MRGEKSLGICELEIIDTGSNQNIILKLNGKQLDLNGIGEYIIRDMREIILELKKDDLKTERYIIDEVKASIDFTNETYRFLSRKKNDKL